MNKIDFITTPNEPFNIEMDQNLMTNLQKLTGLANGPNRQTTYAQENHKIIGGIITYIHGTILWIDSIYVDEKHRQQGIGMMLIEKITVDAKKMGVSELQLNTYFPEAQLFFGTQGFETIYSIPNWKYGLTCYLMRKFV